MRGSIEFTRNYTAAIDEVRKRIAVSGILNSPYRIVCAGRNAKEIVISKIELTGSRDYMRNVGCKTAQSPMGSRRRHSTTIETSAFWPTCWTSRRRACSTASWRRAPSCRARR